MKSCLSLVLICLILSFTSRNEELIDGEKINQKKLSALIIEKINVERKRKSKSELKLNGILQKAALDHSRYLRKKKKLTHGQFASNKKTAMKRTEFYGGSFSYVGENLAFTYLNSSVTEAGRRGGSVTLTTYEKTAEYFFQLWKHSKSHYVNMIDNGFKLSGFGFSFDKKTNRIYGVHVFGTL